jgi:hypothetical protein
MFNAAVVAALFAGVMLPAQLPAGAATALQLNLKVLLIGGGSTDPTTSAWQSALTSEGVGFTEVTAGGTASAETVTLPALTTGAVGNYNGVVFADSPADFSAGQLTSLFAYESTFGVRQIDGYAYPYYGLTPVTGGALDGTTAQLTPSGLTALPELAGPIPFSTGSYGYTATVNAGAPFTPWLENTTGQVLAGVYQHPSTDPQSNVSELEIDFDYNSSLLQWELLAPGLINWVTQDLHLGINRNFVEMDIDDTFTPDNAWSIAVHDNDYSDAGSLRMQPADVVTAANWSTANNFRMDQLFNYGGTAEYQAGELGLTGDTLPSGQSSKPDPLLAEFQATDPNTSKSYADDFGWLSHTYDTPYLDEGCATQDYIEAELNENTNAAAAAPGATAGTGGLGLTESTNTANAYGYENPDVFVPGNHSGFADLVPGTPATVDPPDLDPETVINGTLAAGTYEYAVTDQFNAADPSSPDQSQAYVTAPITLTAAGGVSLVWQAICHAANYLIYRSPVVDGTATQWSNIGSLATPDSSTLPDNSSGDPTGTGTTLSGVPCTVTTCVDGGGQLELTFNDTGFAGTAELAGWAPPVVEGANEVPWEQNPYFIPALEAVGITAVGADASKPYPDPATAVFGPGSTGPATYAGPTYAAGVPFVDGTAEAVPRHPINIFYNASTDAQELDEYNTLYTSVGPDSQCQSTAVTTCASTLYTFPEVITNVVSGMFTNMLSNNPEPTYVHQTNLMGKVPYTTVLPAASYVPSSTTPDTSGDGLLYSVLNPLLSEYHTYFTADTPYEQLTLGAIGTTLTEQTAWTAAQTAGSVTATELNGVVTVTNTGTGAINVPITAPVGTTVSGSNPVLQPYDGQLSNWENVAAAGTLVLNESGALQITSANTASSIVGTPFTTNVTTTGAPAPTLSESGTLPSGITFTNNANGTATIAGTAAAGTGGSFPITITATSTAGTATQTFTLTNSQAPTITSATTTAFTIGQANTYTVTTTGYPAPTITETGVLPSGLTFSSPSAGTATISGTAAAGTTGSYPVSIAATNSSGSTATLSLTVSVAASNAPAISSGAFAYFTLSTAGSFAVTTTGTPAATVSEVGALPSGLSFVPNGAGGALVSGTPTVAGTSTLALTAANGALPNATQTLTINVGQAPAFTSAASASGTTGKAFTFSVTTSGSPASTLTETGTLPKGLTFTGTTTGTAKITGTPTVGGVSTLTLTAKNSVGTTTQTFTLTIGQAPAFTSSQLLTPTINKAFTFTVTTTGSPVATLSESGALPGGLKFTANANGTATISGTVTRTAISEITISAKNSIGTTNQTLIILSEGSGGIFGFLGGL